MEGCPLAWNGFRPDLAAVRFHDRPADREANPHATLFRGGKRLEQVLQDLRRDPGSGIPYTDLNERFGRQGSCSDRQLTLPHILHGLDRIADEIEENLLDLNAVHEDQWIVGRKVELDLHFLLLGADQRQGASL